ncbi:MAG: Holliday junction resolvase RuvX [Chloroflexota bacterium]
MARILGLDIGDKRIGVALSDPAGIVARPLTIIDSRGDKQTVEAIIRIVEQNQVGQIVVGLPLAMDGGVGQQAGKVKAFVAELSAWTKIPIEFRDERLTTVAARDLMRETRNKKDRQKEMDDAIAAAFILQGYLDESHS